MKNMISNWLEAFRLRTLPLALASIGMGSFLAASYQNFNLTIFIFCILTTVCLQILSNLANDYGDFKNGADHNKREGPSRTVQSGKISIESMKKAMIIFVLLSLISGISLLYLTFGIEKIYYFLVFLVLGLLAIWAAVTYTAGDKPYGYAGLGDISVMIFFGWVGVGGTFYLFTATYVWDIILPASSCGFLATAVLNLNNIRDLTSDKEAGKKSIPVRIGAVNAKFYHLFLLLAAILCALVYVFMHFTGYHQLLFLIITPLIIINANAVFTKNTPSELDPFLKQLALTSLLFVLTFGFGQIL